MTSQTVHPKHTKWSSDMTAKLYQQKGEVMVPPKSEGLCIIPGKYC